jgi:hypothetical protein
MSMTASAISQTRLQILHFAVAASRQRYSGAAFAMPALQGPILFSVALIRSLPARILRVAGSHSEKMAVLELRTAFTGAAALSIRTEPLIPEELVVSLAYPNSHLRFAQGRFVRYGAEAGFASAALLEMHDGNDRLVLDHGASGAPVLDCKGQVVAVVSTLIRRPYACRPVQCVSRRRGKPLTSFPYPLRC